MAMNFSELTHDSGPAALTVRSASEQFKTSPDLDTVKGVTVPQDGAYLYVNTEDMAKCTRSSGHSLPHGSKLYRPKPYRPRLNRIKPTGFRKRKSKPNKPSPNGKKPPRPPKGMPRRTDYKLFALKRGLIDIELEPGSQALRGYAKCSILVRVPRGLCILFKVMKSKNAKFSVASLITTNVLTVEYAPFIGKLDFDRTTVFANYLHFARLDILIEVKSRLFTSRKFQTRLRFKVLHRSGLQLLLTSGLAGFVQTPYFEKFLPTYILHNAFADVIIPSGHMIMVSFPWREVVGCIKLKDAMVTKYRRTRILMSAECTIPTAHSFDKISRLRVSFTQRVNCYTSIKETERKRSVGFRMSFSFHNKSSAPQRLQYGTWNCSVPYWHNFRDHFLCNFHSECSGKEDEASCSYTTEHCGSGYFQAGDACFFLERLPVLRYYKPSSVISSNQCLLHGGRLASLKTKQRYDDVRRILHLQNMTEATPFYIGLRGIPSTYSLWYKSIYQWADGTMAFHTFQEDKKCERNLQLKECGHIEFNSVYMKACERSTMGLRPFAICEKITTHETSQKIILSNPAPWSSVSAYVTCPSMHVTHMFMACDVQSVCFSQNYETCSTLMTPRPPSFQCRNLIQNVPYTLVCDHSPDCADNSDEDFCVFQGCGRRQFSCRKQQCISSAKRCDGWRDCFLGEDEMKCTFDESSFALLCLSPPAVIDIGQKGLFIYKHLNKTSLISNNTHTVCPETHFQCPDNGFCLPVFLRCNDVFDCTNHEDEADCDIYVCPGFYRCRASTVCVHRSHVCDGRPHCPQHDDELLCDLKCPQSCVCRGMAFFCSDNVYTPEYPALRYLDAEGTNMTLADERNNHLLIFLSIVRCFVTDLGEGYHLPNLISLDVSDNYLTSISDALMNNLPRVKELFLSGNPLLNVFGSLQGQFPQVQMLHLSRVHMSQLNVSRLVMFPNLHTFNLSQSGIDTVLGNGFPELMELRTLDLRGCPMIRFPGEMFQRLSYLQNVFAQSFRICCPVLLPADFNLRNCFSPIIDVSSCENLLGSVVHRVSTSAFTAIVLVANLSVLVYRTTINKLKRKYGFSVFMTHLSISNFLMGIYLAIIILADRVYNGIYMWNDISWRYSVVCSTAGFLSILSSEASALIMAVITFDRFLVLFFPRSPLQFGAKSAQSISCVIWILSLLLTSLPLLPWTSRWQWYSQTGICIPLLFTRTDFPGHVYFFGIVIVFNFTLFVLIGLGQLLMYCYLCLDGMSISNSKQKNKDMAIARRFITVAMSDFLCWFTIGLLGLLASTGIPVSDQVNVSMTVYVMPLNAALNPFLYTTNVMLERRRHAFVEKMRTIITAQLSKKL